MKSNAVQVPVALILVLINCNLVNFVATTNETIVVSASILHFPSHAQNSTNLRETNVSTAASEKNSSSTSASVIDIFKIDWGLFNKKSTTTERTTTTTTTTHQPKVLTTTRVPDSKENKKKSYYDEDDDTKESTTTVWQLIGIITFTVIGIYCIAVIIWRIRTSRQPSSSQRYFHTVSSHAHAQAQSTIPTSAATVLTQATTPVIRVPDSISRYLDTSRMIVSTSRTKNSDKPPSYTEIWNLPPEYDPSAPPPYKENLRN